MEAERKTINLGSSSSVALEVKDRDKIGLCLLIINQCLRNIDYLFLCLARMKNARDTFPRKGITKAMVTWTVLSFCLLSIQSNDPNGPRQSYMYIKNTVCAQLKNY